ncbi:cyclic GMP-AMP synthase isoform X2 [Sebastes umbrosus]|uniref:cyclic GMP-AMP synthase isoform X2 n=1 Tax=Sebastes umbrosus TaxID=72105 RepID=UPI00189E19C5|nr:cyclic GMP-AMP synthase isoform X2 [Sebastes umbrosus]
MTGRGRPRRAKSPDTECAKAKTKPEEMKRIPVARYPGKDFTEGKANGITKEQKPKAQKKTSHTEEKPSVQSACQDKTAKHLIEEIKKELSTPTGKTKAPVLGTKAKTCAGRAKTTDQSAEEIKTKPDTAKDALKTPKAKKCGEKAKSPEQFAEMTKAQPEAPKDATKACVPRARCEDKVDSVLHTTLEKLKIKRDDRSDAAGVVNKIVDIIIAHLKETHCFKEVAEPLRTGSYYENLKISDPDEFDVMLPIPVDRVNVNPFGDDGAFYSVELKRGKSPLQKFQKTDTLSASEMLKEFRDEVKKCVKKHTEWEVTRKKAGCPAVTLLTTVKSITISLDVVLSIVVKSSWPPFTKEGIQIDGWLGTKVKQQYKGMPYYLVPKYEGKGTVENDGVLARDIWRVSFSHVEKAILKNHGSEKTCCEKVGARCCRKDCLKLLKHLLSLLKEKDTSFDKFCSYHAKTTLLHACCSRTKDTEWRASSLSDCFQLLLEDFVAHLEVGLLHNFFIPTQNLLSGPGPKKCNSLARRIKEECDNGFPIFK